MQQRVNTSTLMYVLWTQLRQVRLTELNKVFGSIQFQSRNLQLGFVFCFIAGDNLRSLHTNSSSQSRLSMCILLIVSFSVILFNIDIAISSHTATKIERENCEALEKKTREQMSSSLRSNKMQSYATV